MKQLRCALRALNAQIERLSEAPPAAHHDAIIKFDFKPATGSAGAGLRVGASGAKSVSSLCWSALVSLSRLPQVPPTCAPICSRLVALLEAYAPFLQMNALDLDKLIANLLVKLFAPPGAADADTVDFLALSFERLRRQCAPPAPHDDTLAGDVERRLSLQQPPPIEGIHFGPLPFALSREPDVARQCYAVALDCLLKVVVLREQQEGGGQGGAVDVRALVDVYVGVAPPGALAKLLVWCSRLATVMRPNEWVLWCCACKCVSQEWDLLQSCLKKRRVPKPWAGPLELVAVLTDFALTPERVEAHESATPAPPLHCTTLTAILTRSLTCNACAQFAALARHLAPAWVEPSPPQLRELLAVLDRVRAQLPALVEFDGFLQLLAGTNAALTAIKLPAKYAACWGTLVLKTIIDSPHHNRGPSAARAAAAAINLLLSRTLDSEFRDKTLKAAAQAVPFTADVGLLGRLLDADLDGRLLAVVLDHVVGAVSVEFMAALTGAVMAPGAQCAHLLKSWVGALSLQPQMHQPPPALCCFAAAKAVALHMVDARRADDYLDAMSRSWSVADRTFSYAYFCLLNERRRPCHLDAPILNAIKSNRKLDDGPASVVQSEAELDAHLHHLQRGLRRDSFMHELEALRGASPAFAPLLDLFCRALCGPQNPHLLPLHRLYLAGHVSLALRRGYETLKRLLDAPFDFLHVCIYLHRLACVAGAMSEARWFCKQVRQLAESLDRSQAVMQLFRRLESDFDTLSSRDNCFDLEAIECVLQSERFGPFTREHEAVVRLQRQRQSLPPLGLFCTGIVVQTASGAPIHLPAPPPPPAPLPSGLLLDFFAIQHAKIELHLEAARDARDPTRLFGLFCRALGYPFVLQCEPVPSNTLGVLWDFAMNAFWVLSSCANNELLLFRIPADAASFRARLRECATICHQNTETLRNTADIAADPSRRAAWWQTRRELDQRLDELVKDMDALLLSDISSLVLPSALNSSVKAANLQRELAAAAALHVTDALAEKLVTLGSFPRRRAVEMLLRLAGRPVGDESVALIRRCFEDALELGSVFQQDQQGPHPGHQHCNLLIEKTLSGLPWESFPSLLNKACFRRVLIDPVPERPLQKVFYIVNPSGDLVKTQQRFEQLFRDQAEWTGIVGRKPSSSEFFAGISGDYDLFIYFGHAGGEIYAPLHELKRQKGDTHAAAALLVGCSSGKIRVNGIFAPQSSVFHYLGSESPLVLAALWDVTDKDIDTYIQQVMTKSGLLHKRATLRLINEQAERNRSVCYLKALNGYAPVVYGPLIK